MGIGGRHGVQELGVLGVGDLVPADLVAVGHRAEAALRLGLAGVPWIAHRDPVHGDLGVSGKHEEENGEHEKATHSVFPPQKPSHGCRGGVKLNLPHAAPPDFARHPVGLEAPPC